MKERGFSLVEVLVVAGLLGGLALVSTQMISQSVKSRKRTRMQFETQSLVQAVSQHLLNDESCYNTLSRVGQLSERKNVDEIRNRVDDVIFNTTDTYGQNNIKIDSMKVKNVSITPDPIPSGQKGYGEVDLVVDIERLSMIGQTTAAKIVTHTFPLRVETDPNKVTLSCYAATENAVMTAKKEVCSDLGGVFNSSTDECDLQDVKAQRFCIDGFCRSTFEKQDCTTGDVIMSVNSDGSVSCAQITCPDGEILKGIDSSGSPICEEIKVEKACAFCKSCGGKWPHKQGEVDGGNNGQKTYGYNCNGSGANWDHDDRASLCCM